MEQISLFNYPEYKINKPVRLIELFAGIGAQAKALERLGINFEHYRVCEFDKFAIKSYNAIHGTDFETSDITKISAEDLGIVDTDKYCYIMTYSFPCQDLSIAGKQKGMSRNSNTRSGLLWQVERLLKECPELPQILVMENVPQVHGKKNVNSFNEWIGFLESKGYSNYWKDLNSKNFGVPQNRNRCFMISILGEYSYNFPNEFPLNKVLLDLLENEADVDSKYYVSDAKIECMRNANAITSCYGISKTIRASGRASTDRHTFDCIEIGKLCKVKKKIARCVGGVGDKKSNNGTQYYQQNRIYAGDIALAHPSNLSCGSYKYVVDKQYYLSEKGKKYVLSPKRGMATDINPDIAQTITAKGIKNWTGTFISDNIESINKSSTIGSKQPTKITLTDGTIKTSDDNLSDIIVRKLTPRECWRLMDFDDTDFDKAQAVVSNSQLYKQAGNSIVVSVLYYIFKELF